MKRSILSICSVVLSVSALAHGAQAVPQVDSSFDLHTLRLSEFDTRNKSDFKMQTLRLSELDNRGKSDPFNTETVTSEVADNADDTISQALSITQKRQLSSL
ncbi:MAG: hypothetical protein AAFN40_01155 [Cyanobacteria bacterium J06560_6]